MAIRSQGVVISVADGASPLVYSAIGEIVSFTGPGGSANVIDVSALDSSAREKLVGLADNGQLTLEVNYDPANEATHSSLRVDRDAATLRDFRIVFTDTGAEQWDFQGYILGFSVGGSVDEKVNATYTIEITGTITVA